MSAGSSLVQQLCPAASEHQERSFLHHLASPFHQSRRSSTALLRQSSSAAPKGKPPLGAHPAKTQAGQGGSASPLNPRAPHSSCPPRETSSEQKMLKSKLQTAGEAYHRKGPQRQSRLASKSLLNHTKQEVYSQGLKVTGDQEEHPAQPAARWARLAQQL